MLDCGGGVLCVWHGEVELGRGDWEGD